MDKQTLARPYAKAAFSCALTQNQLGAWQQFLQAIAQLFAQKAVQDDLNDPTTGKIQKAQRVYALYCDIFGANLQANHAHFIQLLIQYKKLHILAEIAHLYRQYYLHHTQQIEVIVRTPYRLDQNAKDTLRQVLAKRYHKKEVCLEVVTDTGLIAGLVVETRAERIDASLQGRINAMLEQIQY